MNKKEFETDVAKVRVRLQELINNNNDCPQELLDLLESKPKLWRIAVAKQFIDQYNWRIKIEAALNKIKWRQAGELGLLMFILGLLAKVAIFG